MMRLPQHKSRIHSELDMKSNERSNDERPEIVEDEIRRDLDGQCSNHSNKFHSISKGPCWELAVYSNLLQLDVIKS